MHHRILASLPVGLLTLSIVACGSSSSTTSVQPTETGGNNTESASPTAATSGHNGPSTLKEKIASSPQPLSQTADPLSESPNGRSDNTPPKPEPPSLLSPVLMPQKGESSTEVSGCLARKENLSREPVRGAASPNGPEAKPNTVRMTTTGDGIIVTHSLRHACCLAATVNTTIEDHLVRIEEQLSGTPCRCMCGSTLKTSVGLGLGDYTVEVVLDNAGNRETVHRETVSLRPIRPR